MKAVILAGGFGSRISEETYDKPKPMIKIGDYPILWHLMKLFYHYGINDFIICCGYKSEIIKHYFLNYNYLNSDFTINNENNRITIKNKNQEKWTVNIVDTGINTMTGGRLKKVYNYIKNEDNFFFTYGDGLSNINLIKLLNFHKKNKKLATMSVVRSPSRYGVVELKKNIIKTFHEKPLNKGPLINGGFFVLNPKALKLIKNEKTVWENDPINNLVNSKNLSGYQHNDFWYSMDTLRDKKYLEELWNKGKAPWKIWK